VGIKGVLSSWDARHETITDMPSTTSGLDGWYAEAVFGVENIFNVLRLDVHHRVTPTTDGMREAWGLRVGVGVEL
jgi:hypothetical protein